MLTVRNRDYRTYDNDIRALLQAFYPGSSILAEDGEDLPMVDVDAVCAGISQEEDRFTDKSLVKRALYQELSRRTGRELPWGTLTGIRPVRIVEMMLARGMDPESAREYIREMFLVSEDKLDLMFKIYEREQQVLARLRGGSYREGYSIYIGIPFCPTRCLYCSFTSNPIDQWSGRVDEYLDGVEQELLQVRELMAGKPLQTVYVGGGTPTALSAAGLDRLLGMIRTIFREEAALTELTVEAGRPDSITGERLEVLLRHGTDRISVNPQTMHQKTLDLIGRRHTVEQTLEAYALARSLGFDNINMDLIMGLPGEDLEDVRETLRTVRDLAPDSLTVHALAVKRSSRLSTEGKAWGGVERKGLDEEGMDEVGAMTALGSETAAALGLEPYYLYRQKNMAGNQDNTGYAAPGKECIYNILMMEEKHTVIGVGAGSSTKLVRYEDGAKTVTRFENVKNISDYLERLPELLRKKEVFLHG